MQAYAIHWFRRDLRVAGNPALQHSWKKYSGKVLGLFCFDATFLAREDFSARRFALFLNSIQALKKELHNIGSDLLILDAPPQQAFQFLFEHLKNKMPDSMSYNRDYEPFARHRDQNINSWLKENYQLTCYTERDHLLIEPTELSKDDGKAYTVYTPFSKKWFGLLHSDLVRQRIAQQANAFDYLENYSSGKYKNLFDASWQKLSPDLLHYDKLEHYIQSNQKKLDIDLPLAGSQAAFSCLKNFKNKIIHYAQDRDFPSQQGTSKLSLYLKNGTITSSMIIYYLQLKHLDFKNVGPENKFLKEIIWREFYYHILYHFPEVEHQSFQAQYKNIAWENNQDYFRAWCEGLTGYPIVDAAMRELKQTGNMHNRCRMIVASFLCKDLLIDWRWGEKYFMNMLLDGDLAANNGGWQWCASTGCDAQPYFRIFNPTLQSLKFDPEGLYIKKYVPELSKLDASDIHEPNSQQRQACNYPMPIVDHSIQRVKAIELYKYQKEL